MFRRRLVWVAVLCATLVASAGATASPDAAVLQGAAARPSAWGVLGAQAPLRVTSPTRVEANSTTYQDSTGENPAAPDISTIVVSNNDARAITFRINIPNRATLTPDMLLLVFADTDANPATGDPDSLGADYVIQVFGGEAALFRWDGVDFTRRAGDPPATTLGFSYSEGVTIGISAAELGNTQRFGFAVIAVSGIVVDSSGNLDFTNAVSDVAPAAGAGLYVYDVRVATSPPPPPPPQPPPPTQPQGRTIEDAPRLPSRIRYVGNSIKHVRLGEKLYATMKRLGAPRVVAVACWSKADWPRFSTASATIQEMGSMASGIHYSRAGFISRQSSAPMSRD